TWLTVPTYVEVFRPTVQGAWTPTASANPRGTVTANYGQWINTADYGYVWLPDVKFHQKVVVSTTSEPTIAIGQTANQSANNLGETTTAYGSDETTTGLSPNREINEPSGTLGETTTESAT